MFGVVDDSTRRNLLTALAQCTISHFRSSSTKSSSWFLSSLFSEEYHQKLPKKEVRLDTDEYSHVHPAVLNQFDTLLREYPHAFLLPGATLRRIHGTEHHINTGNALPSYKPPYRMSPSELQAVRDQITAILKQDIIRPSKSPWGAPAILVCRKDLHGKPQPTRFVVNYRALNSVTKSD